MKVGFVGLGNMGSGMARNLLRAGHEVTVFNRSREKAEAFQYEGAQVGDSPAAACRGSEAVFSMLADDNAVADMVFSEDGIAAGLERGAAHISSSTISAAFARRLADEHSRRDQGFISAPVFGRPEAAEAAKLIVIAGGEPNLIARFQSLFDAIGRRTFMPGPEPWHANALKLCGNFMIASMLETFGEAVAAMRKAEVDPHLFLEVMNELFGSPVYKNYGGLIGDEKYEPAGFALKLGLKDVRQALELGQELAVPMPFASVLRDQFLSAIANGQADLDWSSVARVSARNAGLQSRGGTRS